MAEDDASIYRARDLINARKYNQAYSLLNELLPRNRRNGRLNYLYAICLHAGLHDYKKSLYYFSLAEEYGFIKSWIHYSRSYVYLELLNYEAAITELTEALKYDPSFEPAIKLLRETEEKNNRRQIAETSYGKLRSPVIIGSVPKSGTLLLYNLISEVLGHTNIIPSDMNRAPLLSNEYLQSIIQFSNVAYFGHIWFSEALREKISHFPKILLIRDPRDNVISLAHFLEKTLKENWSEIEYERYWKEKSWEEKISAVIFGMTTPREYPHGVYDSYMNYAVKWFSSKSLVVRYEDLITPGKPGLERAIDNLQKLFKFMAIEIDRDILSEKINVASNPSKSGTFRSGLVGEWKKEFTPEHVEQMKLAAPNLVSALGYEKNEDWDLTHTQTGDAYEPLDPSLIRLDNNVLEWSDFSRIRKDYQFRPTIGHLIDEWALNLFLYSEQYDNSSNILARLLEKEPHNSRWNYLYAITLHKNQKEIDKALEHYEIALQKGFDEFWVRYNRASLYIEIGDKDKATSDIRRMLKIFPDHPEVHKLLKNVNLLP